MSIYLDVPFVSQLNYGPGMNDPTGCWYCSACMVAYYFEAGPRLGVPELHTSTLPQSVRDLLGFTGHFATGSSDARLMMDTFGGGLDEHELLAEREGLQAVDFCDDGSYDFTIDDLDELLRKYGPIFFYWRKTNNGKTYGHASVLIGTEDASDEVCYHDPENAPNSWMDLTDFNTQRQRWEYAMMRRKGLANALRRFGN